MVPHRGEQDNESKDNERETSSPRKRNPTFDALTEACGYEYTEMTKRQAKACAVAAAELDKVGATVEEVRRRADIFRTKHPGVACTPNALANQWAALRIAPVPVETGMMARVRAKLEADQKKTQTPTEAQSDSG